MPINVNFFQFQGYAFKPESISFGDGESLEVKINRGGKIANIPIVKRTVTFSLEGATDVDLQNFETERENNVGGLIAGTTTGQNIDIFGYTIYDAILTKVTPSAPIQVNGFTIYDKVDLEYTSLTYV